MKKQSLREQIVRIRKGRSITVKANSNVAAVTAHRALGKGKYAITSLSDQRTAVKRLG